MRRREPARRVVGTIPAEFAMGRCIEVWGSISSDADPFATGPNSLRAHSRYSQGRQGYTRAVGLEPGSPEYTRTFKGGAPWSIAFLIANGRAEQVESRLQSAGVTMSDIPRLQKAAQRWVQMKEAGHDRRP